MSRPSPGPSDVEQYLVDVFVRKGMSRQVAALIGHATQRAFAGRSVYFTRTAVVYRVMRNYAITQGACDGKSKAELARLYKLHRSHVDRIVRGQGLAGYGRCDHLMELMTTLRVALIEVGFDSADSSFYLDLVVDLLAGETVYFPVLGNERGSRETTAQQVHQAAAEGASVRAIAKRSGLSKSTVHRILMRDEASVEMA